MMNGQSRQELVRLVATYCNQGKLSGRRLLELCNEAPDGRKTCIAIFQELI